MRPTFDERDAAILASNMAALEARPGPRVGDYVRFACGTYRRISYHWDWETDGDAGSFQTSDGGSFYLGDGYVSFSGSLYHAIPGSTLADTGERRPGCVWFFHHNFAGAHCGVDSTPEFRVYACSLAAKDF